MSFQPRTLEYIPSGFFEVRFTIELPNDAYERWAATDLAKWNPKLIEKTDESQTSAVIVYTNKENGGGGWLSDYTTLRLMPGSKNHKAQLSVSWTPGNRGTQEVFDLLDSALAVAGKNATGDFYIGDEGYGLEHKGKLNADQIRALLGTTKPQWKIPEVQEKPLEYFTVEITEMGVTIKG